MSILHWITRVCIFAIISLCIGGGNASAFNGGTSNGTFAELTDGTGFVPNCDFTAIYGGGAPNPSAILRVDSQRNPSSRFEVGFNLTNSAGLQSTIITEDTTCGGAFSSMTFNFDTQNATTFFDAELLEITIVGTIAPGITGSGALAGINAGDRVEIVSRVAGPADGVGVPSITFTILPNTQPIADAGNNQTANEDTLVTLDGAGSSDPDGDALTFAWTQTAGPAVTLSDTAATSPTFTAPTLLDNTPVTLTFSLIVNDGTVASVADTVDITVNNVNETPLADAGDDQDSVTETTLVTLDGSGSSDPDGDALTFAWTQTAGPAVTLSDAAAAAPTFTVPSVATDMVITFALTVNDGFVDSEVDEVSISVLESTPPTVVISGVPETTNAPFTASFTFSEDVTGFAAADLVLGNASASDFQGSGTLYTALITPAGNGASTIDVPADVAQDAAGNGNEAAAQASTVFDDAAPSVILSGVPESVRGPFELIVSFNEDVTGFSASDVTVENGTASNLVAVSAQDYTVTITPDADGLVTMSVVAGAAVDAAGNESEASNILTTDFIDEDFVRTRTSGIINNFIARRADQITLNDPDLARRLLDQGTGGRLSGQAVQGSANLSFSGKVSGEDAGLSKVIGANEASKVNAWVEASYVSINAETADSDLTLVHAGVDYRVSEDTLIGVLGQYDWADEEDRSEGFSVSGNGWLVGPYVVSRLGDNLIVDGRAAYGESDNDVSPFNTFTDEFDTDRWLLKGQATGDFKVEGWNVNPSLAVIYYEETQDAYTDSLGIEIPEQTVTLGRVSFGPRLSKTFATNEETSVTPSFGVRGVWDFEQAEIVDLNTGFAAGSDELRARTEAGITINLAGGTNVSAEGFYDGIGASNFEAYGVTLGIRKGF